MTGLFGAVAILAGAARPRAGAAGAGGRPRASAIDVSLLESTLAVLVNQAQNAFVTGVAPGRLGNAHPNIVPYETFATADGEIAVGGRQRAPVAAALCDALGLPGLASDPRFATNGDRVEHRAELRPILAARFADAHDGATGWPRSTRPSIPAGPINDVPARSPRRRRPPSG